MLIIIYYLVNLKKNNYIYLPFMTSNVKLRTITTINKRIPIINIPFIISIVDKFIGLNFNYIF